jgi:PAS domain S-box-containing protein
MITDTQLGGDLQIVFPGNSVMAAECRSFPWETTSLGPPSEWISALRTAVAIVLESPFPMNLWSGPDLNLIYNDGYRAVLGAKHPQALGRPGREVWSEIWPEISGLFDQIRAGGPATYAEDAHFLMERASGPAGEAWFTFSLSPVRDEEGSVVAFLNVAAETTERVLAERAMINARAAAERAEDRLRNVFAQAPAFLAVLRGKTHVFEFANDAYMTLVGNRDIIGKPVAEALPEVREQGFIELLDKVYETGAPYVGRETAVALARSPNDAPDEVYLDFVYQPLVDGSGERVGIVAHGSNVTDAVNARREVEHLLRASEQARADSEASEARYRFLANSIPVQVWTATPEGALDYVSDRAAASLGRTAAEVIGEGWLGVLHPDDVTPTIERWTRSLQTGEPYEVEFRLWDASSKTYRWHLGRASAQRDESGRIIRWFGSNTDIEESKRTEEELRRLTDDALEANRAKSDFLAAMSHDLRTPLNAIGGYAQLIEMGVRGPVTDAQKADLERIQRSKSHLDRLVSDVLSFAKLGAGRIELRCEPIKLKPLLGSVVDMIRPQLAEKKLNLAPLSVDPELRITADLDKTQQILVNLLANALKFTPSGGTISLAVAPAETRVAISVTDTGIGVPEEDLQRIFEPFAQAKRALVESDAGVGLGLAISRQLARAMGGDLTVASKLGSGSSFTLTIPRTQPKKD